MPRSFWNRATRMIRIKDMNEQTLIDLSNIYKIEDSRERTIALLRYFLPMIEKEKTVFKRRKRIGGDVITHQQISPICVRPGDSISLTLNEVDQGGKLVRKSHVLTEEVKEEYTFDEAMIFRVDDATHRGLGGTILERK